jgi:serine phosphatase RsbU (regulator of sigma subunit)
MNNPVSPVRPPLNTPSPASATKKRSSLRGNPLYDSGSLKVTLFASFVIVFSMLLVGVTVYLLTEREAVNKLKTKDLPYIADSIASKIDGKIGNARETSLILANDPEIIRWIKGKDQDPELKQYALQKINLLVQQLGYTNSFIVSDISRNYWGENGKLLGTVSPNNPDDAWFFKTLTDNAPVTVVLDYNAERGDTFIFVNALMYDGGKPIAVVGVGMGLQDLSQGFAGYKYGEGSSLWLIDGQGKIYLSDQLEHNGTNIRDHLPESVAGQVVANGGQGNQSVEFADQAGTRYDLISYPLKTAEWRLVVQVPRSATIGFLKTIQINTGIAVLIALISIVFFFFYVSRKLANPYKRALQVNEELEKLIAQRTKELAVRNENIMDSIAYAKRIQESVLPEQGLLDQLLKDYFVLWKPRDVVGGDFYWARSFSDGFMIAIGDCTGHGVPGAFMTMLAVSALNQLASEDKLDHPGQLLEELNRELKRTLHQEKRDGLTDDGLDLGLCCVVGERVIFASARCSLYIASREGLKAIKGDRRSIGYRRTSTNHRYTETEHHASQGDCIYLTTDGYPDQNGGEKDYSFGRTRFQAVIERCRDLPMAEQAGFFEGELQGYMQSRQQRDDITVVAFRMNERGE